MPTTTSIPTAAEQIVTRALITDLRSQGWSWNRIAARLNELSIPTFGGGARWWVTNTQHAVGATSRQQGRTPVRRNGSGYLPHGRTFGTEIEWDGGRASYSAVASAAQTHGVNAQVEGYTHAIPSSAWRIMADGSCSGEAVSPILSGNDGLTSVRGVMRGMRSAGCGTGNRASVHLHVSVLDFQQADIVRLLNNLRLVDRALHAYVADHRLNAYYCSPMNDHDWNVLTQRAAGGRLLPQNGQGSTTTSGQRSTAFRDGGSGVGRYRRYNLNPVLVYGTVEFRAHGATLNIAKFRPWVAACTAIVEATRNGWVADHEMTVAELVAALTGSGAMSARAGREFIAGVEARNARGSAVRSTMLGAFALAA